MLKKSITYTDLEGNKITEDFYFNLRQSEMAEWELSFKGGLKNHLDELVTRAKKLEVAIKPENYNKLTPESQKDLAEEQRIVTNELYSFFKELIVRSYGEKSADGKKHIKYDEDGKMLGKEFVYTDAYDALITELLTNTASANGFIEGVFPAVNKAAMPAPKNN